MKIKYNFVSVIALSTFLFVSLSNCAFSQTKVQFSILSGYQMLGSLEVYQQDIYGDLVIDDAAYYSTTIGLKPRKELLFELQYIFQSTSISFNPYSGELSNQLFDADVHYIMIGGYIVFQFSKITSGYFGMSMGAAGFVPEPDFESAWRVAFAFTLGTKFMMSKNLGIKIQAQSLFPIQSAGGSLFVGPGGAGYGVGVYSAIVQINVGGGLYYTF